MAQDEEAAAEFPRMDGSTSAIPLEAGLRSELYDISYYEALSQVSHTTTHQSFDRLLYAETDLIFSVPLSEEQLNKASSLGVTIEMEPVAKEGFVFVINAANPVDSLTQDQIRKIYSGEITNWKEVGGNDAPILAYQRNEDSGSQNYMTDFMGDVQLMDAPISSRPGGMEGMMDAVASYDNAKNAIGYSVYSYAAQMYANQNKVKFVAVDGVEPSKATMADGTYPLLSCTYVMYKSNHSRAGELSELVAWMISEDGQHAVLSSGYIPVMNMDIPDYYLPYESVGTGIEKSIDYAPSEYYSTVYFHSSYKDMYELETEPWTFSALEGQENVPTKKVTGFRITFLKDEDLQNEINNRIEDMIKSLDEYALRHPEMIYYSTSWEDFYGNDKIVQIEIVNGYMSITIGYPVDVEALGASIWLGPVGFAHFQYCETFTYDLINRKEIKLFSDLFYDDEDFVPLINESLTQNIAVYYTNDGDYEPIKGVDFSGLLGNDIEKFTISSVYFDENSPYFQVPVMFTYESQKMMDSSMVWQYREMSHLFTDEVIENRFKKYTAYKYEYGIEKIGENEYYTILSSRFYSDDYVKKMHDAFVYMQDTYRELCAKDYHHDLKIYSCDGYYEVSRYYYEVPIDVPVMYFDSETFEQLSLDYFTTDDFAEFMSSEYGYEINCNNIFLFFTYSSWKYENSCILQLFNYSDLSERWYYTEYVVPKEYFQ